MVVGNYLDAETVSRRLRSAAMASDSTFFLFARNATAARWSCGINDSKIVFNLSLCLCVTFSVSVSVSVSLACSLDPAHTHPPTTPPRTLTDSPEKVWNLAY